MQKKVKPNEKCPCGKPVKYKKCCMGKEQERKLARDKMIDKIYTEGHPVSSDTMKTVIDSLKIVFSKYKIIDITKYLTPSTYEPFHLKNFTSKVIMVAERCKNNESVFATRMGGPSVNIIMLYRGAYRTFNSNLVEVALYDLEKMVKEQESKSI